jgi:hypothetical protein
LGFVGVRGELRGDRAVCLIEAEDGDFSEENKVVHDSREVVE